MYVRYSQRQDNDMAHVGMMPRIKISEYSKKDSGVCNNSSDETTQPIMDDCFNPPRKEEKKKRTRTHL